MDFSWTVTLAIAVVVVFLLYVVYMSSTHGTFRQLGIPGPTPWPVLGNFFQQGKLGLLQFQLQLYRKYKNEKVYGVFDSRRPLLVVRDLDMIRDIMVKQFNHFVNRRDFIKDEPFSYAMTMIKDEHWKNVRSTLSATYSSAKLRQLFKHIESKSLQMRDHLREQQERNQEVEVQEVISCFTLDVIASTGFGVDINTVKDPKNALAVKLQQILKTLGLFLVVEILFPFLWPVLHWLGWRSLPRSTTDFVKQFVDEAIKNRNEENLGHPARNDLLQLMLESYDGGDDQDSTGDSTEKTDQAWTSSHSMRKLSYLDIQGEALMFIMASYETLTTAMSFTLYLLAINPECCAEAQREIDQKLGKAFPTYDTVQDLSYLEMCIYESIRLYTPVIQIDRECKSDAQIQGVFIPQGMIVIIPLASIHKDPEYWSEPDKFDPQRFTPENKATRHPFAFLPFGQGPRNCIGARLALLEMKVGLAAILQTLTPVPCAKSEQPIKLQRLLMKAANGLWVKMEARN